MVVKFCGKNVFDVFVGDGWENWTRFEIYLSHGKRMLRKLGGRNIPAANMSELRARFMKGK